MIRDIGWNPLFQWGILWLKYRHVRDGNPQLPKIRRDNPIASRKVESVEYLLCEYCIRLVISETHLGADTIKLVSFFYLLKYGQIFDTVL